MAKSYGGVQANYEVNYVRQTADGGYIVAGVIFGPAGSATNGWLLKLDDSGDTMWQKRYGSVSALVIVAVAGDGGYIAVSRDSILKIDSSGNAIWQKSLVNDRSTYIWDLQPTADG